MGGKIVGEPVGMLAQDLGVARAGFFFELAESRGARIFALVDPALRHLPSLERLIDALADENVPVAIEQHDADAGTIGKLARFDVLAHGAAIEARARRTGKRGNASAKARAICNCDVCVAPSP